MPRRAHVLATSSLLALGLVVGGGYAVNAAGTSSSVITACSHTKTGAVRIVSAGATCAKSEKKVTWNVKGATGARGLTGAAGARGATGAAGTNGRDGSNGSDGSDGRDGVDGQDGARGPAGADGVGQTGPAGPAGPAGSDGAPGAPGAAGTDGEDGAPGASGPTGPAGPTGPTGPTGPAGPAGPAGGSDEVDPNPYGLTYRMKIGNEPITEITGFTQEVSNSGTTHLGTGGGAGKATFGDLVVTLPMNSRLLTQMLALAKGNHITTVSAEMCKPGEIDPKTASLGSCSLSLTLEEVLVAGIEVAQDPGRATATVQLNFAREKLSVRSGAGSASSFAWDIAENVEISGSPARATSTGDTTYTATVTGRSGPIGVLSTRSWHLGMSQSGTTHMGSGGGAGKASFSDVAAETRSGHGTTALFRAVATGERLTRVELAGCEVDCASTTVLSDVTVTKLVLGSPSLFDQVELNYATIKWDRNDDPKRASSQNRSFGWDIPGNVG